MEPEPRRVLAETVGQGPAGTGDTATEGAPVPGRRGARTWVRRLARNRLALFGAVVVFLLVVVALFAPWLAPHDPFRQDYGALLRPPSPAHPLGTDELGRDELSRLLYGARISLEAGILSVGLAVLIGLPLGLFAGFAGGFWDEAVIGRLTDAMLAFPSLILALAIAAVLGPSLTNAMLAIGVSMVPTYVRLVRGQVLAEREREYVEASRALGAGAWRQLFRHILPNVLSPLLVQASLGVASAVIAEASLSYLGLGTQPPTPSWGSMLHTAQGYLTVAPWLATYPGLAIFVTVLAINLVGDGLRDLLDPRQRRLG
ncbi:MAG: ABC transporter permease [Bacillota bacterium]|nr:ABC transporter permease [Bacillota bacterium]